MSIPTQLFLILICLIAQAFFAGMETGVISVNRLRLQHLLRNKAKGAKELQFFLNHPEYLLSTTLVGTNLCMVIVSVLAASLADRLIGASGEMISAVVMTLVILIFAEYLPKAWFQSNPAERSRLLSRPLRFFGYLFYPVGQATMFVTKLIFRITSTDDAKEKPLVTKEEMKHLTLETERTGGLSLKEREMIDRIFDLDRKTCADIMTKASDIVQISADTPREELLALAREQAFRRYPVYRHSTNNVVGIVNVFDAATDPYAAGKKVSDYMRPPQFIPEDTPPDELITRLRVSRQPLALVQDSEAEIAGLITIEDVLKEIIGTTNKAHIE